MIRHKRFKKAYLVILILTVWFFSNQAISQTRLVNNKGLHFTSLPQKWDEAIPLGNGMLGALIYEKDGMLRFALDRIDLWDLRPLKGFYSEQFSYNWISQQVFKKDYKPVQDFVNKSDIKSPAPTKIPAGAMEFPIKSLGEIDFIDLDVTTATCTIKWVNGTKAIIFIDATQPKGYFRFENLPVNDKKGIALEPQLLSPNYQIAEVGSGNIAKPKPNSLANLGYKKDEIIKAGNAIYYHQNGWQDFSYDIAVGWRSRTKDLIEGTWSVTSQGSSYSTGVKAAELIKGFSEKTLERQWHKHKEWWKSYWEKSTIEIPDPILMQHYNMNMYLFASASRKGGPPISLQAVWTADDGNLPPWKGDYHNDLNTELSYWPGYASNHMEESAVFTDWLWKIMPEAKKYTSHVFQNEGLNVPGVVTLSGQPMDAWLQYSTSPTTACWLAQHFYWQWIYSGDENFLKQKAYPWLKGVATHLRSIAIKDKNGKWKLPISSSPEVFDNSLKAWFTDISNFDLSLIRWTLNTTIQMADTLHLQKDALHWRQFLKEWPELATDPDDGALLFAPEIPYNFSHRHFSNLMSIFPLQTIDWYNGEKDQKIIKASLAALKKYGSKGWVGYSYVWQSCLESMNQDGESAAKALKIYTTAFCSPNSFHLNGDQSGKGYSGFTYRPFTLEGNFAFAQAIQLMLLQQHNGVNYIFPSIPLEWKNSSFSQLRTPGGFLISAKKENGIITELQVKATKDGLIKIKNPFPDEKITISGSKISSSFSQDVISLPLLKGEMIKIMR